MPEPVSPGADFALVTGDKETVSVRRLDRQTGATVAQADGIDANRMRPGGSTEGTTDGGGVPVDRLTWHVRSDQDALAALPGGIRKADQLTDAAGVVWVVQSTTKPKYGEPYEVQSVKHRGT